MASYAFELCRAFSGRPFRNVVFHRGVIGFVTISFGCYIQQPLDKAK